MDGLFPVSTKIALYSEDKNSVLVIKMRTNQDVYELPGGHLHENEDPDAAMARELYEETGLTDIHFERKNFFVHSVAKGKIILAYTGMFDASMDLKPQLPDEGTPVLLSMNEFNEITTEANYKTFVLSNWPR